MSGLGWRVLKTFSQVVTAEAQVMMSFDQASNQVFFGRAVFPHKCESLKAYVTELHQLSCFGRFSLTVVDLPFLQLWTQREYVS